MEEQRLTRQEIEIAQKRDEAERVAREAVEEDFLPRILELEEMLKWDLVRFDVALRGFPLATLPLSIFLSN